MSLNVKQSILYGALYTNVVVGVYISDASKQTVLPLWSGTYFTFYCSCYLLYFFTATITHFIRKVIQCYRRFKNTWYWFPQNISNLGFFKRKSCFSYFSRPPVQNPILWFYDNKIKRAIQSSFDALELLLFLF